MHLMTMKSVPVSSIRSRKRHKLASMPDNGSEEMKDEEEKKDSEDDDKDDGEDSQKEPWRSKRNKGPAASESLNLM